VINENKLPPKSQKSTCKIRVAMVVNKTKYQYRDLFETLEKFENLIKPSLVAATIEN
jgi:hypothetical protein